MPYISCIYIPIDVYILLYMPVYAYICLYTPISYRYMPLLYLYNTSICLRIYAYICLYHSLYAYIDYV